MTFLFNIVVVSKSEPEDQKSKSSGGVSKQSLGFQ